MLLNGETIEEMSKLPEKSINLILADLPYGTTQNKWDEVIPFNKLWEQYERIIADNGAIVLTGKQPFTSMLIMSNQKLFKYCMVWRKNLKTGNLNARKMPMGAFEDIVVFYKNPPTYNPQQIPRTFQVKSGNKTNSKTTNYGKQREEYIDRQSDWLMPDDVIDYEDAYALDALELENEMLYIKCVHNSSGKLHPTQKPVELFEWLVKTYTSEGDVVLDNTSGSGTTAVAAEINNRKWICIEQDRGYCEKTVERLKKLHHEAV
ncbi:site-specific DNA-methyltransferase [Paenibacillus cremeus]|uniref:Methyltransferase n=2 Tax=Paenibacillus cremeus TaxID=2163881 RepID=A0A559KD17_9BACL|nr:site-specific DNA-methyltransferase [Paenibacillus cremeus]